MLPSALTHATFSSAGRTAHSGGPKISCVSPCPYVLYNHFTIPSIYYMFNYYVLSLTITIIMLIIIIIRGRPDETVRTRPRWAGATPAGRAILYYLVLLGVWGLRV